MKVDLFLAPFEAMSGVVASRSLNKGKKSLILKMVSSRVDRNSGSPPPPDKYLMRPPATYLATHYTFLTRPSTS